ncbi:stage II sporulation protein M [Gemmatimonas sp.]|uniref:stage II sporulation protein M n=1 Tax=Gemmatimonas sp. TaxID=1962908 RepID=UPI00286E35D6|nr:stage II sporulation protein M [Gemmatimonas sp.]
MATNNPPASSAPGQLPRPSLSQTVDVETPELVVLSYTVAGVGSRATAAFIDYAICIATFIAVIVALLQLQVKFGVAASRDSSGAWVMALLGVIQFAILWLYYVLFEALGDGQTPGKRIMKLRVVKDGGLSVTFEASAIRNIVRAIDLQPIFLYAVGLVTIMANARGKRLGDMAAGTIVVKEDLVSQPVTPRKTARTDARTPLPLSASLTDAEFQLLDRFVERRMQFDPERRTQLAAGLAQRFSAKLTQDPAQLPIAQLVRLHDAELAARAQGAAARNDTGAARERHRIVATNAPRWALFANTLKSAQGAGLSTLGEAGVRRFVQDYREMTADLARLRTATRGQDSADLFYLNRLVAGAHSLLYRRGTFTLRRLVAFLFADVPAEVRASGLPIAIAATLLFGPMVIAARAVITHPSVAATLLPQGMLARAAKGVDDAKRGKGYIEDPEVYRPMMASQIATNNVQVTFVAFAGGMTAGLLTCWALVMNGVSIGAALGLYISKGIGSLIFSFIAPHGVLELTAIVLAGAAGLLLASGMLLPGNRTRRAALVHRGGRAFRLLAGAVFLLLFAGAIEGFVSPNATLSLQTKLAVSATSAVVLAIYLFYKGPANARPATARPATARPATARPAP